MARRRGSGRGRSRSSKGGGKGSAGADQPGGARLKVVLLVLIRLWLGAFFLVNVHHKLLFEGYTLAENYEHFRRVDYVDIVQGGIQAPPEVLGWRLDLYADFLEHVMLPGADVFAPLILAGEALLGVALVLGAFTRLAAFAGLLMMVAFSLARALPLVTVKAANWPVVLLLAVVGAAAAGRRAGLDGWLRPRLPAWLRWTT